MSLVKGASIVGVAFITAGCPCTYAEAPTRAAFQELSEDAGDLITVHQQCVQDPEANQSLCDQVTTTLQSIKENAAERAAIGQSDSTEGGDNE